MKLLLKLFALTMVLCAGAALQASAQAQNQTRILHPKGLLWKIDRPGYVPSYIFGTMHIGDRRVVELPVPVEDAFDGADRFAMEMLLNYRAISFVTSHSFFDDGRTLRSVMKAEDYQRLIKLLGDTLKMPEDMVQHMRPWAVLTAMMMPGESQDSPEVALDMMLYRRAAERKIPLLGLESPQEQLAVFENLPMDEQVWLLNRSVEEFDKTAPQMDIMLEAYLNRDLQGLVNIQQQYMYDDSDIDDRFMYELIDKRNLRMVERMQEYLRQGNAFIAIGALHLPGDNGVLHLLEQRGFRVTPVY
jgi:hypothetical protein